MRSTVRRRGNEEERRAEILRAAFAVAARDRLGGVSARAVAAEAGVSPGLVFFYFESVDNLLVELLHWLLARTIVAGELAVPPAGVVFHDPEERLLAVVRRDVEHLYRQRARVELFFDYWVLGTRNSAIRTTIRQALDRYRDAFTPLAAAVVAGDPLRWHDASAEGLATIVASFVEGCALQVVLDPRAFDVERSMASLGALMRPSLAPAFPAITV